MGRGWKRWGPVSRDGDARGPQTGSVSTRRPPISTSTVEWPSQVARNPLCGGLVQLSSGFIDGSGLRGTRRSPPQMKSTSVGIGTPGSRKPGGMGWTIRIPAPAHSGDAFMRSSRAPVDLLPNDLMMSAPLERPLYFMGLADARARNRPSPRRFQARCADYRNSGTLGRHDRPVRLSRHAEVAAAAP